MTAVADPAPEPAWVDAVLRFWLVETPPEKRFAKDAALDRQIAERFGALRERLRAEPVSPPHLTTRSVLAAIIVLDQFSRNLYRGSPEAFAADPQALHLARWLVETGRDRSLDTDARLFVYLPFEHSEDVADQDRSVDLTAGLGNAEWDRYAIAHRDIIRRFGRFPHRNAALGRTSTPQELAFLKEPGSSF